MYADGYIQYLVEFHVTRDWFECHEIMEEMWKQETDADLQQTWLVLIRLAVGLYHERRGNLPGAEKMYRQVENSIRSIDWKGLGIEGDKLTYMVGQRLKKTEHLMMSSERVRADRVFETMNLPIDDPHLLKQCQIYCNKHGLGWNLADTDFTDELIHRHRLRDRSDVIAARQAALNRRLPNC
ncbi:DUF309 domain-containing protein [Paenibacillus sp. ACRRX]|uniref:DUF309 domain-containing protein n=1 Tax=Paenibacillus sp. ACRRX TaxID=2918206 RepID=UPI001EF61708|nr:DUF309 domain-containing protein [Paenibacillus sp. ACRRX]MCG7406702.1 DUF309 domain-containing protein [Paenibacillus sp. ACRRX]